MATVELGIQQIAKLLPAANDVKREPIPVSELTVGLECGGSDGNSGVTANPAVGIASDLLVAGGGTAMLSEMPEVYGAEHLLTLVPDRWKWPISYERISGGNGMPEYEVSRSTTILRRVIKRRPDYDCREVIGSCCQRWLYDSRSRL